MSLDHLTARKLTCLLTDNAQSDPAALAAIELIADDGFYLHTSQFRRLIAAGSSIGSGAPVTLIRWRAVMHALDQGMLLGSPARGAVLRFAAAIADDQIPIRLGYLIQFLDPPDLARVTTAMTRARQLVLASRATR